MNRHTGESRYLKLVTHAFVARDPGFRRGDENNGYFVSCCVEIAPDPTQGLVLIGVMGAGRWMVIMQISVMPAQA